MNINNFLLSIARVGLLNPTRYTFNVSGPAGSMDENQTMKVSSMPWPGKAIDTIDNNITVGPMLKVPVGELYDTLPIVFYSSKDMNEFKFWNTWMTFISGERDFKVKHYADIVGQANIQVLDEQGQQSAEMDLVACYPTNLSQIDMGYDMVDQVATFTVDLSYHHYEIR